MMTNVLSAEVQATLVATVPMCSVTTAKSLAKTATTKSLHSEHLATTTGHIPSHVMTTTIEMDNSSLTTDTTMEDTMTNHNHTTNITAIEALAATKDMHPTLHPTTAEVHAIL